MTKTMKAVRLHDYGAVENLIYEDAPIPQPQPGEVLIKVHAVGINPIDCKIRAGKLKHLLNYQFPVILGMDVSGIVAELGEGVTDLQIGEEIYGVVEPSRSGAYAEYAIARYDRIAPKPKTLDFIASASLPVAALTAWQSMFDVAQLSSQQSILIHAASGAVGIAAVQLAKWKGAKVIGTASTRNIQFVSNLGADQVIDYTQSKFEDMLSDIDVVLDSLGGEIRSRSWKVLKKGGFLVSLILSPPPESEIADQFGVKTHGLHMRPQSIQLKEIAELVDDGILKTAIAEVLPLSEILSAHQLSESSKIRGKIMLQIV